MSPPAAARRNPGPAWGHRILLWAARTWPRWLLDPALVIGAWGGVLLMPDQRRHSRNYLQTVLGRPPRWNEIGGHFLAFTHFLVLKLRAGAGLKVSCELEPTHARDFEELTASGQPALYGTFHVGWSDLLGYLLSDKGQRVSIVRLQVGNSDDTRLLGERFDERTSFLWVNDADSLVFRLKDAMQAGDSLALKCDRLEFSAKVESFEFLGARRMFPFSIYHLALLFDRPVIFCIGVPATGRTHMRVISSPVFQPDRHESKEVNLQRARGHFQEVLKQLETLLRARPQLWFNFLPLNPEASPPGFQ